MGLSNRDKDSSEQMYVISSGNVGAVATSVTLAIGTVPTAGQIRQMTFTGKGLSGAPSYNLVISRWTTAGQTTFAVGSAVVLAGAFGLSGGVIGATYAANSSLATVQAGDLLQVISGVANTAVTDLAVSCVIQATQDIKKSFDI
jgi:hypothetical protein